MQIPAAITSKFGRQILLAQKNAPQLLFAGGISAGITSTVLACKATLQLETKLSEIKLDLDTAREAMARVDEGETLVNSAGEPIEYTAKDLKQDTAKIYAMGVVKLIKLYGPAIGMGVISIALLTKSNHILNERNASLAAAYATVDKAFKNYRERVIEDHGAEKDAEYLHGVEETEEINPETNRKRKVRRAAGASMYAKFFDETNRNFMRDPDTNLMFLNAVQSHMNHTLQATGHVFLNDVYDALGIPRTRAGSQVGWLKGSGDDYIDFGIYEGQSQAGRDFVNGKEGAILLDFNVDGEMWNLIDESGETDWLGATSHG